MFERLEEIKKRFLELEEELAQAETVHNQERYLKLVKEHSALAEIVAKYDEHLENAKQAEELKQMEQDDDPDIAGMAKEELAALHEAAAGVGTGAARTPVAADTIDERAAAARAERERLSHRDE